MPKLTYWVSEIKTDSDCYNIRSKTKKDCIAMVIETGIPEEYAAPHKVTVEYKDAFSLMAMCLSESRLYEGE